MTLTDVRTLEWVMAAAVIVYAAVMVILEWRGKR